MNKSRKISIPVQSILLLLYLVNQTCEQGETPSHCKFIEESCGKCITHHPDCAWCTMPNYTQRCDLRQNQERNCERYIEYPESSIKLLKNNPVRSEEEGEAIHISPQEVEIHARINNITKFSITYHVVQNYPVDLYVLMDMSHSMKDVKDIVANLSNIIASHMQEITKDFRLGFGMFVDKPVLPYVFVDDDGKPIENPCLFLDVCEPTYGFRNLLKLTSNMTLFKETVLAAKLSGNVDNLDGGLDALMQVLVCKDEIGWRARGRRTVLLATSSGFHYAGSGKLGGIVKRNTETCHLDENGYYTESTSEDYPSVGQISENVREQKTTVIFAVKEDERNFRNEYEQLRELIMEGSSVEDLSANASSFLDLVNTTYREAISKVELITKDIPNNVELKIYTSCLGGKRMEQSWCPGLVAASEVTFDVELKVTQCTTGTTNLVGPRQFEISPVGVNERVLVKLYEHCQCDCQLPEFVEMESPKCSNEGTLECGQCHCSDQNYGRQCECEGNTNDEFTNEEQCKINNQTCSGRGFCYCGVCRCNDRENPVQRIYGSKCELDNFSCDRDSTGQVCGGEEKAWCENGKCICRPGWKGDSCDCSTDNTLCEDPNNKLECSGNGDCECGGCICHEDSDGNRYSGRYCEECPTCEQKCSDYEFCAHCQVFGEKDSPSCKSCIFSVTTAPELDIEKQDRHCRFIHDKGCVFEFTYRFGSGRAPIVIVKDNKACPAELNTAAVFIPLVVAIVLGGVIVIAIFRITLYFKDKREFARFEKSLKETAWSEESNPIYKGAVSKFKNPLYQTEDVPEY